MPRCTRPEATGAWELEMTRGFVGQYIRTADVEITAPLRFRGREFLL